MIKKMICSIGLLLILLVIRLFTKEWDHQLDIGHVTSINNDKILHKISLDYHFEYYNLFPVHLVFSPYWHPYYTGKYDVGTAIGLRNIDDGIIYGANIFFDYSNLSHYSLYQLGSGWELLLPDWQFRLNTYYPVFDPFVDKKRHLIIYPDHFIDLESKYLFKDMFVGFTTVFDFNRHKWGANSFVGYNYSFFSFLLKGGYDTRHHWNTKISINLLSVPNHKFKLVKIERNKGVNYEKVFFHPARKVSKVAAVPAPETPRVVYAPMQSPAPIYYDPLVEVLDEHITELPIIEEIPIPEDVPEPEEEVPWWNFWAGWFESNDSIAFADIDVDAAIPAFIDAGPDVDVFGAPLADANLELALSEWSSIPSPDHSRSPSSIQSTWSQIDQDLEWEEE